MLPMLSKDQIRQKINKIGFNLYPDILVTHDKCSEMLTGLYEAFPELFHRVNQLKPDVFALSRSVEGKPNAEHTLIVTPKGCTLTFSSEEFQRDSTMKSVTNEVIKKIRNAFPVKKIPRVGRIVELVLEWPPDNDPHVWMRENFTVFDDSDDVDELNFRMLHRSAGMNINTIMTPVRHRQTSNWGLQIVCDINNSNMKTDIAADEVGSIIDFSTLYFPDRTFEFLNRHVEQD
ncbi:MAG: hypothetical protein U5N86_09945 [Planctomycetota bacterium]|nr:hypothetical protein [Planctomycetota bacterium]